MKLQIADLKSGMLARIITDSRQPFSSPIFVLSWCYKTSVQSSHTDDHVAIMCDMLGSQKNNPCISISQ